jgi:hypothetical protein
MLGVVFTTPTGAIFCIGTVSQTLSIVGYFYTLWSLQSNDILVAILKVLKESFKQISTTRTIAYICITSDEWITLNPFL